MGEKVVNHLSISGFADDTARRAFREAAAKGSIAFSFERLLPLAEPEEIELAARWGTWIYEQEEDPESVNNGAELFTIGEELGIAYAFDSHNDPPFSGIRHISRTYPDLLLKLHSEDTQPAHFFALYKNGERFSASFEEEELSITRAGEWPMIAALSCDNWQDETLHAFIRDAADKLPEDLHFVEETDTELTS